MNRLDTLFQNKDKQVLSVYFTAGFPQLDKTQDIIKYLEKYGADLIEIGMPFSDSIADGPVIQKSNDVALKNGMSVKLLFEQLKDIRKEVKIPLILMGSLNPVMQFGAEAFAQKCQETGIDGLILPDLPMQEYLDDYKAIFDKYGLYNILLVPPQTSDERIKHIDDASKGFVYVVSSTAVTGAKADIESGQMAYFERIKNLKLKNKWLIGFGISDNKTFTKACEHANGAIIGSAFINTLSKEGDLEENIKNYVESVLKG